jgi:[acyl-carrier-protein] S-malonyltransferase
MKDIVALFPGQGSQVIGMGRDFLSGEHKEIALNFFQKGSDALGFDLKELCLEDKNNLLNQTAFAQPAILTVNTIAFFAKRGNYNVLVGAGHSLGEYSALVASGAIDFSEAVKLVHKRGLYMQEAMPLSTDKDREGVMVAILGVELELIEEAILKSETDDGFITDVANINAPGQVVISGHRKGVNRTVTYLEQKLGKKVKSIPLPVSVPSHSRLMREAALKLGKGLEVIPIKAPSFPIICNVTAKATIDPTEIKEALLAQLCGRVRWVESMHRGKEYCGEFVEFGHGEVLTGLLKRIFSS